MEIIDLSHMIHKDISLFPGMEIPTFTQVSTIERDGYAETNIQFYSHTGTHIDAPSHMVKNAPTLTELPLHAFLGSALVIDCRNAMQDSSQPVFEIPHSFFLPFENKLHEVDFLLLLTGWSEFWGTACYFDRYPTISERTAAWLTTFDLKGIGLDAISIDDIQTKTFPIHKIILSNRMIIIENLTHLNEIKEEPFLFSCLPLKYENADGSPVRAVAISSF
jgi:arylformamidase